MWSATIYAVNINSREEKESSFKAQDFLKENVILLHKLVHSQDRKTHTSTLEESAQQEYVSAECFIICKLRCIISQNKIPVFSQCCKHSTILIFTLYFICKQIGFV